RLTGRLVEDLWPVSCTDPGWAVGAGEARRTYESPFSARLESAQDQAERRFATFAFFDWVGTALSADWMRPSRCFLNITFPVGKRASSHPVLYACGRPFGESG